MKYEYSAYSIIKAVKKLLEVENKIPLSKDEVIQKALNKSNSAIKKEVGSVIKSLPKEDRDVLETCTSNDWEKHYVNE